MDAVFYNVVLECFSETIKQKSLEIDHRWKLQLTMLKCTPPFKQPLM